MAIGLITPNDQGKSMAEDVLDLVTNVDFESTPFFSQLAVGDDATNTLHQWLVDEYAASAHNAAPEGNDMTFTDINPPVRQTNIVQLFQKDIRVSNTEQRVAHYGMSDPYSYQLKKKMTELARDIEKALVAGTVASGNSGVARQLNGAIALISTNKTVRASGTSLSETEFNDILQGIYDNGTDLSVDKAFAGAALKRAISGYTAGSTKNVNASDGRLWNSVDVYESDFGVVSVFLEREVPSTAGSRGILLVDSSKWQVSYLTNGKPQHIPLATIGSAKRGMLEAELTLTALNEKSSAFRGGYL